MKRKYALIVGLSLVGFSFGQGLKKQLRPVPAQKFATEVTKTANAGSISQDKIGEFWTDDFSTTSNWTIDNSGMTDPTFGWDIGATEESWFFSSVISSTSGGNFAELSNGNPTTGTQALDVIYTLTTAQPIDIGTLAGTNIIKLSFLQYGARFNDAQEIYISEDGSTFTKVGDNSDIPVLSSTGGSAYDNPTLKEINLGDYLSASPTQLWIRFSWTTAYPASSTNPNVWVTYGWMIDDVTLSTSPQFDLGINKLYWGTTGPWGTIPVYKMPQTQIAPVEFTAAIENKGSMNQTGITFEVTDGAGYTGLSAVSTLDVLGKDTVDVVNPFTPPAVDANYTFNFMLNSDSTDVSPVDNTLPSKTFEVNQSIYAVDNDVQENYYGNQGEAFEVGNVFNIFSDQTLYNALVNVNDGSNVGAQIYVKLYEIDPTATTFAASFMEIFQNQNFYTITTSDLGNWVQIPFETPQNLEAGKSYGLVIGTYGDGGATDDFLCNAAGATEPGNSVYYVLSSDTWYYTNESQMIRMDFSNLNPVITSSDPDFIGCVGDNMTLTSSSSSGNQWNMNGSPIVGQTNATLNVTASGDYSVTVGGITSNVISVTVNNLPVVNAGADMVVCMGSSATLTAIGAVTYTWDNGLANGATFAPAATATYIVIGTDANGCSASDAVIITVNALPAITLGTVTQPSACAMADGSIQVTGTATGNLMWSGTASGSITGVTLPQTIASLSAGTYMVNLTDANGCISNTVSSSLSDPGITAPVITADDATTFCMGGSVNLTSDIATGITWTNAAGTNQTINVTTSGSYSVTLIDGTCTATSNTIVVTVSAIPTVTYTQTFTDVCSYYADVVLTPGTPAGGTFSGTGIAGTIFDPSVGAATYSITYSVTQNGCTGSASSSITVAPCMGINENEADRIVVYPNPSHTTISISSVNLSSYKTVTLTDQVGRIIGKWIIDGISLNIDVQKITDGNYHLVFEGENTATKQIQILH